MAASERGRETMKPTRAVITRASRNVMYRVSSQNEATGRVAGMPSRRPVGGRSLGRGGEGQKDGPPVLENISQLKVVAQKITVRRRSSPTLITMIRIGSSFLSQATRRKGPMLASRPSARTRTVSGSHIPASGLPARASSIGGSLRAEPFWRSALFCLEPFERTVVVDRPLASVDAEPPRE
jgi:hypothetical protein